MILFDNEYLSLEYDEQDQIIIHTWKKYTPSEYYKEGVITHYEVQIEKQVFKVLADCRRLPTISAEDARWTVEIIKKYYPLLRHPVSAVVVTENIFTQMSIRGLLSEFSQHQRDFNTDEAVRYFSDIEEGREWLKNR